MADGRRNNGGHKTAGRKSKAEEFKLIEKLDSLIDLQIAIEKMYEHITNGSEKMLELYMGYRFGKPTQSHDHKNNGGNFENNPIVVFGSESNKD